MIDLPFQYVGNGPEAYAEHGPPAYKTEQAAGFDLRAAITEPINVRPVVFGGGPVSIPLGIAFAVPVGYELQLRARSGLASKWGITLTNGVGTIDADYRGELAALISVLGPKNYPVRPGQRICQAVLAPVSPGAISEHESLPESERGTGGFGHTG
ncbi:dUTP diphosphatase [Thiohalorhabdus sp.]|uniref:dUTP diphosphatase n=1 Tax=Thiohalorhabdus sp. TaxID=3094134 RepID=UPI002FC35AE7